MFHSVRACLPLANPLPGTPAASFCPRSPHPRGARLPSALCSWSAPSLPFPLHPVILKIASLLCLPINADILLSANIISTCYLPPTCDRFGLPCKVGYIRLLIVQRSGAQVVLRGDAPQSQALSLVFGPKPSTGSPAPRAPGPVGTPPRGAAGIGLRLQQSRGAARLPPVCLLSQRASPAFHRCPGNRQADCPVYCTLCHPLAPTWDCDC